MADPITATINLVFSAVKVAASVGTYMEAREQRKFQQRQSSTVTSATEVAVIADEDMINDLFLVLSLLGQRLLILGVIRIQGVEHAHYAARQAISTKALVLLSAFDSLELPLQYAAASAMVFSSATNPVKIWAGFGAGVLGNVRWHRTEVVVEYGRNRYYGHPTIVALDEAITLLPGMTDESNLLTRLPIALKRFGDKHGRIWRAKDSTQVLKPYVELNKEIEKRGIPQCADFSRISSYWIPSAAADETANLRTIFTNDGTSFYNGVLFFQDPGRLLYAFTVGGHLNLQEGEAMLVLPGASECIVTWLEGLNGMTFQLIPSSKINYSHLKLGSTTRKMFIQNAGIPYYAVLNKDARLRIEAARYAETNAEERGAVPPSYSSYTQNRTPPISQSSSGPHPFTSTARRAVPAPPAPPSYPPIRQVTASYDFTAEQDNELSFRMGDILQVLVEDTGDGWLEARLDGKTGAIPAGFVQSNT